MGPFSVPGVNRRLATLTAIALAWSVAGCGGGTDLISEGQLRDCLANQGLSFQAAGAPAPSAGLGNVSADFSAGTKGGGQVDLIVSGSDEKARRQAADISGALQSFGVAGAADRLLSKRNVVAVFDQTPSSGDRDAVSACLD